MSKFVVKMTSQGKETSAQWDMANESYFRKAAMTWDAASGTIKT